MAEFVMKDLVKKAHLEDRFEIASAATSTEEIWGGRGNPVYPPARSKLKEHGIDPGGKRARRTTRDDYKYYDYLIGMDYANIFNMKRIYGGDPDGKISLLLDYCGRNGQEVADPWYTDNFDETWHILERIGEPIGEIGYRKQIPQWRNDNETNSTDRLLLQQRIGKFHDHGNESEESACMHRKKIPDRMRTRNLFTTDQDMWIMSTQDLSGAATAVLFRRRIKAPLQIFTYFRRGAENRDLLEALFI